MNLMNLQFIISGDVAGNLLLDENQENLDISSSNMNPRELPVQNSIQVHPR